MSDERQLTKEDREKIQRLLESGTLENVTLALSLIEETAGQEDIADIFTMNVIVELICLNGPESLEVMVMAGQFIRRCPETWKRFNEAVVGPTVLTSQKNQIINKTVDHLSHYLQDLTVCHLSNGDAYDDGRFKYISLAAAERIATERSDLLLDGLREISDAAAESLSHNSDVLSITGLTSLSDAAAESLGNHAGHVLGLDGLTELSDAAAESLSKYTGDIDITLDNLPASAAQILRAATMFFPWMP